MLTAVTFAMVCGGIPARAQEDSDDPAMMQHSEEVQQNQGDEEGTGKMGHGMMRHGGMKGPLAMRIIFALRLTNESSKRWTPTKMAPLVRRRC